MAKNLIGATWCDASNGEVIEITNPATNALIDTVPKSTKEDCDKAVEAVPARFFAAPQGAAAHITAHKLRHPCA